MSDGTVGAEANLADMLIDIKNMKEMRHKPVFIASIGVRRGEYELIQSGAYDGPIPIFMYDRVYNAGLLPAGVLYQVAFTNGDIELFGIDGTVTSIRTPKASGVPLLFRTTQ